MGLPRSFGLRLGLLAALALAVRLFYTLAYSKGVPFTGDAFTYHLVGGQIADGNGFVRPATEAIPSPFGTGPTAEHAPLYELFLGALSFLGIDSVSAQKSVSCLLGTATVALVGLAGRSLAGERAGLIAALLAALYPLLWVADGSLMSESLYGVFVAGTMLLALRFARAPGPGTAVALGAVVGLAALTRGEALMLAALLLVPLALTRSLPARRRVALAALSVGATLLVITPWTVRNLTTFEKPVLISTSASAVFAGANCEGSYHGRWIGMWQLECYGALPAGDESEKAAVYRRRGLDYARDHAGRLPLVAAVRFLRVWDLFRPRQQVKYEYFEGRSRTASYLGLIAYYPLLVLAVAGAVILRRRGAPLLPVLAFPLLVSVTAVLVYGLTRFRFAAEPAIVVLAAVALDAALRRRRAAARLTAAPAAAAR
jgi:4-amino-4-deoxy-L-arabinose transferase-like glycosyltransferase